jgi:hypothetical protein
MICLTDPTELIKSNLYFLYFYTSWVPDHQQMLAMFSDLEAQNPGIHLYEIDIEILGQLGIRSHIPRLPAIFSIQDGHKKRLQIEDLSLTEIETKIAGIYQRHKEKKND